MVKKLHTSNSVIRVLHVIGRMDRAGAESMLMSMYRAIDRKTVQFDFLYFTDDVCDFDAEIKALGGMIYRLPENKYKNPISRMAALKKLLSENPQIVAVHAHTLLSNAFHLLAAKRAGITVRVAHSHNAADSHKVSFKRSIYEHFAKKLINKYATHRVACGSFAAKYLFGSAGDVAILNNAVDTCGIINQATNNPGYLRNLVNCSEDELLLIQVARFVEVKNHKFSVQIIDSLIRYGINIRLVFVGDGPLLNEVRNYAEQIGVLEKIDFLGVRDDVPRLMATADLMLLPSHHEGFPVVLVEAQVLGLPSLVSANIDNEVDFGLSLVEFLPINEGVDIWVDKIPHIKRRVMSSKTRLDAIKQLGFDVSSNVGLLQDIYKSGIGSS